MRTVRNALLVSLFVCLAPLTDFAQSGRKRFEDEVATLAHTEVRSKKDVVLFTGSSSIRIWPNLNKYFPKYNIVNMGFGGSSMSDLLYYCDDLILKWRPTTIFIYEGDNDLAAGKSAESILSSTDSLLQKIRSHISYTVPIYLISPKPSIARWQLREKYVDYNQKLKEWSLTKKNVLFIDGWSSLLDEHGNVLQDVFQSDNLHLNKKGYDLWSKAVKAYLP